VAKGCTQIEGMDYGEVLAPMASIATFQTLLSHRAAEDLEMEKIDVKTTFLNGPFGEKTSLEAPEGCDFGGKVLQLKRALYGLNQASWAGINTGERTPKAQCRRICGRHFILHAEARRQARIPACLRGPWSYQGHEARHTGDPEHPGGI
jgi:hypothetical protein